jgi:isopenicillin N synthase-like dioxygenase
MAVSKDHSAIPTLDLRRLDESSEERARFLTDLRVAAREVGFFYVVGHGISCNMDDELMQVTRTFFALPESVKLSIEMVNSPHFRGYNRLAWERTGGLADWREQIDIGPERPALPIEAASPPWRRLQGPNQWPATLPELQLVTTRWQEAAQAVLIHLLRAFALSLGQREADLEPLYRGEPHHILKLIRYPGRDSAGTTQGVGAHKDSELLTLLLQDSQGGLQVKLSTGEWVDVPPRAGAYVVNVGELLELATDGYLKATLHRAQSPAAGAERISIAFFLGAPLDATITPLPLPPELACLAQGPERDPRNPLHRQVGQNYLKGRLRSHPDVARRHYADMLAHAWSA